jgi:hypothetical protein
MFLRYRDNDAMSVAVDSLNHSFTHTHTLSNFYVGFLPEARGVLVTGSDRQIG